MSNTQFIWSVLTLAFCVAVAYFDIRFRRIPNRLLVSMLVICLVLFSYASFISKADSGFVIYWPAAFAGFFAALAFCFPFWRFGLVGAGDVKLLAVLGFMFGLHGLWQLALVGCVLAGLHALGLVMTRGRAILGLWSHDKALRIGVPLGAHLAAASLLWMFWLKNN